MSSLRLIAAYLSFGAACLQIALYESMLASPHRTLNGEEADFFFVPVLDSCIITRADDAPHLSLQVYCINCYFLPEYTCRMYITACGMWTRQTASVFQACACC